jgi:all-trans-retinol 13,14-reductase
MISLKQHAVPAAWDAIVIGSGIGGLAVAATLAKSARKRVLVLERHYTAGGFTHSFQRPRYRWDVGLHYVGDVLQPESAVRAAFDYLTDGELEWAPMPEVYDRFVIGGSRYEFPTGLERLRERLKGDFPGETKAIDRYLAAVVSAQRASGLYFAEKAIPRAIARLVGGWMRAPFLRWASQTTLEVVSELTRNRELIGLLTAQWPDYGLPPATSSFGIHAIVTSHYFNGGAYPVGGASRIAATMAPVIERAGGQVVVSAEVAEVLVEKNKAVGVRMTSGQEFRAPVVISDAGARNTFERLAPVPEQARAEVRRIPASCAHLSLYVGLEHSAAELGLDGSQLWVYPSADHDGNLERFTRDPSAPLPVLFVSSPSAKDPEHQRRDPGRTTLEVLTVAPYDWFARWEGTRWKRRGADYEAFKRELAGRLVSELARVAPAVAGKIDYMELSTPLTVRHFMNYERGESYGLAPTPARFQLRRLTPQTPLAGLYLTGQDVTSLGVAGALFGGVVAASAILGKNLVGAVTKPAARRAA